MKLFLSTLLVTGSLLMPVTAYGQASPENPDKLEDAELALAKARLAVAKAEADLAEAKLKAIKTKTLEPGTKPSSETMGNNGAGVEVESDGGGLKIGDAASAVGTAIGVAKTASAVAAMNPKAIAIEAASDAVIDTGTDLAKDGVKEVAKTAVSGVGDVAEDVAKGILSLPGSLLGGSKDKGESDEDEKSIELPKLETMAALPEPSIELPDVTIVPIPTPEEGPAALPEIKTASAELPEIEIAPDIKDIEIAEPSQANVIMPSLMDLPRHDYTAPIDGCSSTKKGLVMGGGFMLFTCEKLLPFYDISEHAKTYEAYQNIFKENGWSETPSEEPGRNKISFKRQDALGCKMTVDMELWTDRSMNESSMNLGERNNHRQIVFKAWFRGDACEVHYDTAELIAD